MKDTGNLTTVVLSGGQDSTTCLFWALENATKKDSVVSVSFDYGQRHHRELEAAERIAALAGVPHTIIETPGMRSTSPLLPSSGNDVGHYPSVSELPGGIEPTFVPCRNIVFLTMAANYALSIKSSDQKVSLVTGVCEVDYGGYPDCRQNFIESLETTLNLANFDLPPDQAGYCADRSITIITPLMHLTKSKTVRLAASLPGCWEALAYTHTCYDGEYPPNPRNHASLLRAKGFRDAGLPDPLIIRAKSEGLLPNNYPDDGLVEENEEVV